MSAPYSLSDHYLALCLLSLVPVLKIIRLFFIIQCLLASRWGTPGGEILLIWLSLSLKQARCLVFRDEEFSVILLPTSVWAENVFTPREKNVVPFPKLQWSSTSVTSRQYVPAAQQNFITQGSSADGFRWGWCITSKASISVPRPVPCATRDTFSGLSCHPKVSYEHPVSSMQKSPKW